MTAPNPKWYEVDGEGVETIPVSWSVGTVDAGTTSAEKEFYIWNNKGGAEVLSDMTNVFITTKHTDGTDSGLIAGADSGARAGVVEAANCNAGVFGDWTEIHGSTATLALISESGVAGTISGAINDGNRATVATKACYARVKLRLKVYDWAPAGAVSWKTRVSYQYT